ncbi:hypothetical protein T484DRAFT_1845232 [Baffinella frigidus]|nr:hypothetical protein T484DRAFT_1845232 [Cryptophyta sp. CCMP2293]
MRPADIAWEEATYGAGDVVSRDLLEDTHVKTINDVIACIALTQSAFTKHEGIQALQECARLHFATLFDTAKEELEDTNGTRVDDGVANSGFVNTGSAIEDGCSSNKASWVGIAEMTFTKLRVGIMDQAGVSNTARVYLNEVLNNTRRVTSRTALQAVQDFIHGTYMLDGFKESDHFHGGDTLPVWIPGVKRVVQVAQKNAQHKADFDENRMLLMCLCEEQMHLVQHHSHLEGDFRGSRAWELLFGMFMFHRQMFAEMTV